MPTPVGPRKMNEPIGRLGSFSPARARRTALRHDVDRLLLADDALVQPLFHVQQALGFLLRDARDGDARPHRHDLGDVLFGDGRRVGRLVCLPVRPQLVERGPRGGLRIPQLLGALVLLVVDRGFLLLADALQLLLRLLDGDGRGADGAGERGWPPRR